MYKLYILNVLNKTEGRYKILKIVIIGTKSGRWNRMTKK